MLILQARVFFAELISYIEGNVDNRNYIFKLSELHDLYESRLQVLGIDKTINKTRLKTQILGHFFVVNVRSNLTEEIHCLYLVRV